MANCGGCRGLIVPSRPLGEVTEASSACMGLACPLYPFSRTTLRGMQNHMVRSGAGRGPDGKPERVRKSGKRKRRMEPEINVRNDGSMKETEHVAADEEKEAAGFGHAKPGLAMTCFPVFKASPSLPYWSQGQYLSLRLVS